MVTILSLIIITRLPGASAFTGGVAAEASAGPARTPEHGKAATADASPVDRGTLEAELGYAPIWHHRRGFGSFDTRTTGYTHGLAGTLTYGVLADVDVKLSAGVANTYDPAHLHDDGSAPRHGSGPTDPTVGARWRFLNLPGRTLELAVIADVVLPMGSRHVPNAVGLTQDYWSARGALVATRDLGALTASVELALAAPISGDARGLRSVAQVNAALGYQLTAWLQPELELNYTQAAAYGPGARVLAVTAGVVAPLGGVHRVVAAVQQGLWGRNTPQATAVVLSFKTAL